MEQELDEALCRDFPLLYRDRYGDMRSTCMCWGFPNRGWEPLIRELSSKLEVLIQEFIDKNPNLPCRWCSVEKDKHDEGWWSKTEYEDDGVAKHHKCHGPNGYEASYPCASQCKEKYGSLRFYLTCGTDEMFDLINEYEEKSSHICEDCGAPGKLRDEDYWILTQCDSCHQKK